MEAHEAHEVGDAIAEGIRAQSAEMFRRRAAVVLGFIAMLLAIASLGGENAMKETINFNILASDTYSFYQARNERQTTYGVAAAELEAMIASHPDWPASAREAVGKTIADYRATVARYESDPKTGEGKRELVDKARAYEAKRDHAQRQDINFDYGRALFQIAIVLGSVSIVATSRALLALACGLAALATLLSINGFFLLFEIPFG